MDRKLNTDETEFDYVIVGAGSAGCVLANRLSADPSNRVLLIEAGGSDQHWSVKMPLGVLLLVRDKERNWRFEAEPESNSGNRPLFWPRGRLLGGSSSINGMVYIRGQKEDYDDWAALGNQGWAYSDILPLFRALEKNENGADEYHGDNGELSVSNSRADHPMAQVFVKACEQAGHPRTADFNAASQTGAGIYQFTQKNGDRCNAAEAFLHPAIDRPNLFVQTHAQATKVTFEDKRATGVAYVQQGAMRQAHAAKEVILCGGAVQSPQLLMLSGIGPKAELEEHGIELRHELPGVGENLQDHQDILISQADRSNQCVHFGLSGLLQNIKATWQYFTHKRGNNTTVLEGGAFFKLGDEPGDRPDVQLHFFPTIIQDHARKFGFHAGYSLHACVLRPKSRGRIGLKSADPLAAPAIHAGYLNDPEDMDMLKRSVREMRRILAQPAFANINGVEERPGTNVQSDAELEDFIRNNVETIYHPVGTCKMGHDAMAVVDDELRVHGIEGLRVADAAIMPNLISGNTNAPCMMVAEKCARMILAAEHMGQNQAPVSAQAAA